MLTHAHESVILEEVEIQTFCLPHWGWHPDNFIYQVHPINQALPGSLETNLLNLED